MAKKGGEEFTDEDVNDGEPVRLVGLDAHVMASSGHGGALPEGSNYNWGEWVKIDSSPITNPKLDQKDLHELDLDQTWELAVGVVRSDGSLVTKFRHVVFRLKTGFPGIKGDIGVSPINVRAISHYQRTQGRVLTLQFDKTMENDQQWFAEATPVIGDMRGTPVFFTVS